MQRRPAAAQGNRLCQVYSGSHDVAISVYDAAGNVIKTHEHHDEGDQPGDDCPKRCQDIETVLAGLIRRLGYRRI
jgi:hypothetical protein